MEIRVSHDEIEDESQRLKRAVRESVALSGFDPDSGPGPELTDRLLKMFILEDLEGGKRPVRFVHAIALGMGLDVDLYTCGCGSCFT